MSLIDSPIPEACTDAFEDVRTEDEWVCPHCHPDPDADDVQYTATIDQASGYWDSDSVRFTVSCSECGHEFENDATFSVNVEFY